jgi:hypothetical protein
MLDKPLDLVVGVKEYAWRVTGLFLLNVEGELKHPTVQVDIRYLSNTDKKVHKTSPF